MKKRTFKQTKIEICRNCQGVGFVENGWNGQAQPVCEVCNGSGRIRKTIEGIVTVEPYSDDNSN